MSFIPAFVEVTSLLAQSFSLFVSVKAKRQPDEITACDYLDGVKSGRWRAEVDAVREANARSKAYADEVKVARLPAVKPSGIFRGLREADFVAHSGIMCIDLDDVGPALVETKKRLQNLPCVFAMHLSPRGTGIKVFLAVTAISAEEHRACWNTANATLSSILPCGVKLDPAPSNVSSNCFVSYDPEAWVADSPRIPLFPTACKSTSSPPATNPISPHTLGKGKKRRRREEVISEESMSDVGGACQSMSDYRAERLSARVSVHSGEIQHRECAAKIRQRARRALGTKLPRLRAIYRQYVENKPVNRGERHAFLLKVIPPLFEVLAETVLIDLLRLHHRSQTGTWRTAVHDHMREVKKVLESYRRKYCEALTLREREVFYDRLHDEKRGAAFRICRGLATCGKAKESGVFHLSCSELATRIDCHRDTAYKILCEFKAERLIERVRVGDALTMKIPEGEKRKATTWRWLGEDDYNLIGPANVSIGLPRVKLHG